MTVRSTRLWGPRLIGVAADELYRAPLGRRVIVKSMRVTNVSLAAATFRLTLAGDASGDALLWDIPVAASSVWADTVWWVLDQDEPVRAVASVDDALVVTGSGAVLVLD